MNNLKTLLTISHRPKNIPYPAASYEDGQRNYGFVSLKGHTDLIAGIEEAKEIPCFQSLLRALNRTESPFFSIACEKSFRADETGHWASGFVEFAYNFESLVADASNYFALFYNFTYEASAFIASHAVQFHWVLQPARFVDGPCDGFTCSVWFSTGQFPTEGEARAEWDAAVACFCAFVQDTGPYTGIEIYAQQQLAGDLPPSRTCA